MVTEKKIPKKWWIEINSETIFYVNEWRKRQGYYKEVKIGSYHYMNNVGMVWVCGGWKEEEKISLEQFKALFPTVKIIIW